MQRTAGIERPSAIRSAALNGLAIQIRQTGHQRIVIAGGPRCGKSELSRKLGIARVRGTDELMGLGWSEASDAASRWFDEPGPWIGEGVAMARALRKWLKRNPTGKPCDIAIFLGVPVVARVAGQDTMAAGVLTVWKEIRPELFRRGVVIRELNG